MDMPVRWKSNTYQVQSPDKRRQISGTSSTNRLSPGTDQPQHRTQPRKDSPSDGANMLVPPRSTRLTIRSRQGMALPSPSSCDIRFFDSTHEQRKRTERQRICSTLTAQVDLSLASAVDACTRAFHDPACFGMRIREHPLKSCARGALPRYATFGSIRRLLPPSESRHPERYRALPFIQNAQRPCPVPIR